MEKHRKFCGAFLVGLSEADSKKYRLILDSRKRDPIEMAASSDMSIISQDDPKDNNKNDYYKGKTVVKRLQRSCSRTFSLEEKQKIVAAYQSGKFCHELGNEYKCSKTTIIKLLRQQGSCGSQGQSSGQKSTIKWLSRCMGKWLQWRKLLSTLA